MIFNLLILFLVPFTLCASKEKRKSIESSYPYISGDTWHCFSDWHVVKGGKKGFKHPEKVKEGDVILVGADRLKRFKEEYLPKIKHKFILICANFGSGGDDPLPGHFAALLQSDKVAAWFVQNIDCPATEKLISLPIGIANNNWAHGDTALWNKYTALSPSIEKVNLVYVNFTIETNPQERGPCLHYFTQMKEAKIARNRSFEEYLQDLSQSLFVISPPGHGLDCHRTWEALLMGCYPVVKTSTLDPLFQDLPVVIVRDWSEVTKEFLEAKQKEFAAKSWSKEKLYAPYWFEKVRAIQRSLRP